MITHFNPQQIKNIELIKTRETAWYYYSDEYKTWWGKTYKAGIKEADGMFSATKSHSDKILTDEQFIDKKLLLIDNVVYTKPRVLINFIDDTFLAHYFETNLEAHDFIEQVVDDCLPIKLMKVYN